MVFCYGRDIQARFADFEGVVVKPRTALALLGLLLALAKHDENINLDDAELKVEF